jgi:hypothetical protein
LYRRCRRTEVVGVDPVGTVLQRSVDVVGEGSVGRDGALGDADRSCGRKGGIEKSVAGEGRARDKQARENGPSK